jgi:hypothetical protein
MRNTYTVPIGRTDLEDVVNALGADRNRIVEICGGIKPGAINWWRHKERISVNHLQRLGEELAKIIQKKAQVGELTPVENRAKEVIEGRLGLSNINELLSDRVRFPKEHMLEFLKVMDWKLSSLAHCCQVELRTAESWKSQGAIPYDRLRRMFNQLLIRSKEAVNKNSLVRVKNHFETAFALHDATGSVVGPEMKSTNKAVESLAIQSKEKTPISSTSRSNVFSSISDVELFNELVHRGWKISLTPRGAS